MAKYSALPRELVEEAWRHGYADRVVRIPPDVGTGKQEEVLADLLKRTEERVLEKGLRAPTMVNPGLVDELAKAVFAKLRQEGERYKVSPSLVHRAQLLVPGELMKWWCQGERRRVIAARKLLGEGACEEYLRARRAIIRRGDPGGLGKELAELAQASVAGSWWHRPLRRNRLPWAAIDEAIYLGFRRLDGGVNMRREVEAAAARAGLVGNEVTELGEVVERAVQRAVKALEKRAS